MSTDDNGVTEHADPRVATEYIQALKSFAWKYGWSDEKYWDRQYENLLVLMGKLPLDEASDLWKQYADPAAEFPSSIYHRYISPQIRSMYESDFAIKTDEQLGQIATYNDELFSPIALREISLRRAKVANKLEIISLSISSAIVLIYFIQAVIESIFHPISFLIFTFLTFGLVELICRAIASRIISSRRL